MDQSNAPFSYQVLHPLQLPHNCPIFNSFYPLKPVSVGLKKVYGSFFSIGYFSNHFKTQMESETQLFKDTYHHNFI